MGDCGNMRRFTSLMLGVLALVGVMGCSKDQGTMVTDQDAEKLRREQITNAEKQIKETQDNPNIPAGQKQTIINNIRSGAARASAGAQSGQAGAKK